jgi:predicted nucleic acid-binding Zn ribbon protein
MLRPRKEPDPLHGRRKLLAEQEKLLAERMTKLHEKLARGGEEEDPNVPRQPPEPPLWRLEEDAPRVSGTEAPVMNKRVLNRQRQRDMLIFFVMIAALVVVVLLVLALAHSHLPGVVAGS